jgi:Bacterial phospho-glucose isomerase C-terminal SIS domain
LYGVLPEAAHNLVMTLEGSFGAGAPAGADDIFRDPEVDAPAPPRLRLVLLGDADELPEERRGREAVSRIAESYDVAVDDVTAPTGHPVSRLAALVGPCDFASVYHALLHGIDPTPIETIDRFKRDTAL